MPALFDRVATEAALRDGWAAVLANDRADGVLSAGVARFAATADEAIPTWPKSCERAGTGRGRCRRS